MEWRSDRSAGLILESGVSLAGSITQVLAPLPDVPGALIPFVQQFSACTLKVEA
jgi:hypothetical protein